MCGRVSLELQQSFHTTELEEKRCVLEPGGTTCATPPHATIACSTNMCTASPFNHPSLQHDWRASSTRCLDTQCMLSTLIRNSPRNVRFSHVNAGGFQQQQQQIIITIKHYPCQEPSSIWEESTPGCAVAIIAAHRPESPLGTRAPRP